MCMLCALVRLRQVSLSFKLEIILVRFQYVFIKNKVSINKYTRLLFSFEDPGSASVLIDWLSKHKEIQVIQRFFLKIQTTLFFSYEEPGSVRVLIDWFSKHNEIQVIQTFSENTDNNLLSIQSCIQKLVEIKCQLHTYGQDKFSLLLTL